MFSFLHVRHFRIILMPHHYQAFTRLLMTLMNSCCVQDLYLKQWSHCFTDNYLVFFLKSINTEEKPADKTPTPTL